MVQTMNKDKAAGSTGVVTEINVVDEILVQNG